MVELITAAASGSGAEGDDSTEPAEETAPPPKVKDVYLYQEVDPKTGQPLTDPRTKKARKPVEVEVTAVDARGRTADLKNLVDAKRKYAKVSWDDLLPPT